MNVRPLFARRMGRDAYKYGKSSEMKEAEAASLTTVCFSAHRCIRSFLQTIVFFVLSGPSTVDDGVVQVCSPAGAGVRRHVETNRSFNYG